MRRVPLILLFLAAAAAAGVLSGCNDRLDDPTTSEGILNIQSVTPSLVEADVTGTDIIDDEAIVTVENRVRTLNTGSWSAVFIKQSTKFCEFPPGTIILPLTTTQPGSTVTIPANGSADVPFTAVTVLQKTTMAAIGDTWECAVMFEGEDLAGNPVQTEFAAFSISFVDQ